MIVKQIELCDGAGAEKEKEKRALGRYEIGYILVSNKDG